MDHLQFGYNMSKTIKTKNIIIKRHFETMAFSVELWAYFDCLRFVSTSRSDKTKIEIWI